MRRGAVRPQTFCRHRADGQPVQPERCLPTVRRLICWPLTAAIGESILQGTVVVPGGGRGAGSIPAASARTAPSSNYIHASSKPSQAKPRPGLPCCPAAVAAPPATPRPPAASSTAPARPGLAGGYNAANQKERNSIAVSVGASPQCAAAPANNRTRRGGGGTFRGAARGEARVHRARDGRRDAASHPAPPPSRCTAQAGETAESRKRLMLARIKGSQSRRNFIQIYHH